jgi:hypothetical protein
MFNDEISQILEALLTKSEAGQVKWLAAAEAGMDEAAETDDFVVLMPNSSINVFRTTHGLPRVNFLDSQGNLSLFVNANDGVRAIELIEGLIESAKRQVFRIDETLEDIKKAVSSDGVIGDTKPRRFSS